MASKLDETIRTYEEWRSKGHEIWDIYEGTPNEKGATEKDLERLRKKLGRALPKDFEEFMRRHDGWDGYEYDRQLLTAKQILDDAGSEAIEINQDNMEDDEADKLEGVFVVGLDNDTATILYYDTTVRGEPPLVEYYCEEQGRWPNLTAYFRELTERLEKAVAADRAKQGAAVSDWDPATREKKEKAYHAELAARWQGKKAARPTALEGVDLAELADVPAEAALLTKNELHTYLGFCGYMLYVPTAEEVTAAALIFRKHFPWSGDVKACAPSDEYGAVTIAPDATDFSQFLAVQSGGHFGLRMVDDAKKPALGRIFNLRGVPPEDGEARAPFLEIMVPPDADPAALRALVLDLADALPLAHGLAGYFAMPSNGKWRDHMRILHGWCRAHWCLEVAHADEIISLALHGLSGVSWLTLVDNATAALVKKDLAKQREVHFHSKRHATVIEAGAAPSLGDIRVAYPKSVAAVHVALAAVMAPGLEEIGYFDEQGGSHAWWRRFEDPPGFAVGPKSLFKEIKAAVAAKDDKALRAALGRLTPEVASSLHQELSDLAQAALKSNKPIAIILYEHLTAGEEPHPANLCNALIALEKTSDRKVIDLFIERALPRGKEMPDIYHNVMWIYAERGDDESATETFRRGAPHYTVELSKLLENDADFAPLRAQPKFGAIHREIRKRLGIAKEWPPLARNADLERKVGEHPNGAADYRRYAKWLTSVDDPRGALIDAHMAEEKTPRSKPVRDALKKLMTPYIRNRLEARHPKLAEYFKAEDFRWGVLDRIYLSAWEARDRAKGLALLDDPECLLLRTLYLNKMKIDLAEVAKKVPYLQELNLTGAEFPSLEPIREFAQLDELRLTGTGIADLRPLRGLTRLRKLHIGATAVADLRPLKEIPSLEFINVGDTKVTNIAPLFELPRLCELWLYKTGVPKKQAEQAQELINARKIKPGAGVTRMVYGP